jgi:hypothetical protein
LKLDEAAELAGIIGLFVTVGTLLGSLGARWLGGWRRRRQLKRLADLRREGTKHRNAGQTDIATAEDLAAWQKAYDIWRREAERAVRDLAEHEAAAFETIGVILQEDAVGGHWLVDGQNRAVAFMSADLRRLEEIRRRYSPTG